MKLVLISLCALLSSSMLCFAGTDCRSGPDEVYECLPFRGGSFHFKLDNQPIEPGGSEFGFIITNKQRDAEVEIKAAELPFLAEPGEITSAFLADADFNGRPELFVVQRFNIYSDTGVNYVSDYYVTLAFDVLDDGRLSAYKKIEDYFGAGGDVYESASSDHIEYIYPYKTEISIRQQIATPWYRSWLENKKIMATVKEKAFLYNDASLASMTHEYLNAGNSVEVLDQTGGWLNIVFHDKEKGVINGWVQCKKTMECHVSNDS